MSDRNRNAIARVSASDIAHGTAFTEKQVELIREQIMPNATDDELMLFVQVASSRGLDPFRKHIYAVSRRAKDDRGNWIDKWSYQVSIDGLRLIAERTGKYEGQLGPFWCGPDGVWRDVWLENGPPAAAKVGVYKTGFREPLIATAKFTTYVQKTSKGETTKFWASMPEVMIAKVAEAAALRRAFPEETGGLYVSEEMDQDTTPPATVEAEGRVVDTATGEIREPAPIRATVSASAPEPDERAVATRRFTEAVASADVDERGVAAWIRSRLNEPMELPDIAVATLHRWSEVIERNPAGFHDHVEGLIAQQAIEDREADAIEASFRPAQGAESAAHDAPVMEPPQNAAQGSLTIDISPEDEAQYRAKRVADAATN